MLRIYEYATPLSHGSGSLAAATAAVIADLEPYWFYELEGRPHTTQEVADLLNGRAISEYLGQELPAIGFHRTFQSESRDEFRIGIAA